MLDEATLNISSLMLTALPVRTSGPYQGGQYGKYNMRLVRPGV